MIPSIPQQAVGIYPQSNPYASQGNYYVNTATGGVTFVPRSGLDEGWVPGYPNPQYFPATMPMQQHAIPTNGNTSNQSDVSSSSPTSGPSVPLVIDGVQQPPVGLVDPYPLNQEALPQRQDAEDCSFYLQHGRCGFGSSCKFNHPPEVAKAQRPAAYNVYGLPLRPSASKCTFYMRTRSCKYGSTCKYDHPELPMDMTNGNGVPVPMALPYPSPNHNMMAVEAMRQAFMQISPFGGLPPQMAMGQYVVPNGNYPSSPQQQPMQPLVVVSPQPLEKKSPSVTPEQEISPEMDSDVQDESKDSESTTSHVDIETTDVKGTQSKNGMTVKSTQLESANPSKDDQSEPEKPPAVATA